MWERESGALHSVGEHAPGLLGKLAWQPNGRNLYAACRQPNGALRVLLFESNGLQHGGFDVPGKGMLSPSYLPFSLCRFTHDEIKMPGLSEWSEVQYQWVLYLCNKSDRCNAGTITRMEWSPDSEFIALVLSSTVSEAGPKEVQFNVTFTLHSLKGPVKDRADQQQDVLYKCCIHCAQDEDLQQHRVQIWQRVNWHWYLKQELRPYAGSGLYIAWSETALGLDIVSSSGRFGSVSL